MRWLSTFTLYAGCLVFLASPAAAQPPITGHTDDVVFGSSTTATVSEGSVGREESSIGEVAGSPLYTEGFQFQSGIAHTFTLAYEPGVTGGIVIFGLGTSDNVNMASTAPFDSILIRTRALHADMSIEVSRLTLGPPPSKGGGGPLLYETAAPLTLASSRAFGPDDIDILKLSGVPRLSSLTTDGFTLQGEVTATFSAADPPPVLDDLLFQLYTSQSSADPSDPDDDGDGVPNSEDNCPNTANPPDIGTGMQANSDGDSLGDACDNCPFADNEPDEFGKQANEDGDIFGDACDNCPLGCTPNEAGTCKIDDDTNSDSDTWGDRCDNCPEIANEDQADANDNGIGNLCDSNNIVWNNLASVDPPLSAPFGEPPPAPAAPVGPVTTVELFIDCSTDVAAANIGINLTNTGTTFLDFSNCTTPGGPNPTERTCSNANLTELGDNISTASSVIGPGITSAGTPPVAGSPPPDMVILQLLGLAETDGGLPNDLICAAQTDDVKLGVLRLENFIVGSNPLSSTGFDTFVPELTQLVGPSGAIPNEQVVFQVNPPGTPLVTVQLRPSDLNPDTHYELSIRVDLSEVPPQEVARIAFGLTSSQPVGLADMNFGGCQAAPVGSPPAILGSSVRGCQGNDPTQLSTRVDDATEFDAGTAVVATYTVGPDPQATLTALGSSRLPDTLYVALDSGFVEEGDAILNSAGGDQWLGEVVFAANASPPQITFQGIAELPGYETSPVVSATAVPIATENVTLSNSFSTSSDSDGDTVPDDLENCVRVENPGQENMGGVGFVSSEFNFDNIGDACQCADPGRDGVADNGSAADAPVGFDPQDDVVKCQEALSGQAIGAGENSDFCKVTTSEGGFSIVDVLVLEADTANPGSSGLGDPRTGSLQNCGAAEGG